MGVVSGAGMPFSTNACSGKPIQFSYVCGGKFYTATICASHFEFTGCDTQPPPAAPILIYDGWVVITSDDGSGTIEGQNTVILGSGQMPAASTRPAAASTRPTAASTRPADEWKYRTLLVYVGKGREVAYAQSTDANQKMRVFFKQKGGLGSTQQSNAGQPLLHDARWLKPTWCDLEVQPPTLSDDPDKLKKEVAEFIERVGSVACTPHMPDRSGHH